MSYRNPEQFVDKQSGQAYVDLIKTSIGVGDAMAKRAREKAKANEKENLRLIREREQGVLNLRTEFAKRSGDNFNADDWGPVVQRYDIIQQKIDNGTATAKEKQEQAEILALPYTAKSLGENMLSNSEEIDSSLKNPGKPGSIDLKGTSPEGLKNAQIFMGQLGGTNNLTFKKINGKWVSAFDINGKVYTESSVREFLNRDLGANVLGRIVPNEGPKFQDAHEFALMQDPGGSTDPKKRVMNPAYLTGIQKEEERDTDGNLTGNINYYRTPNFELLRQPGNPVGAELRANAESLLEMPGNSAVSMWNNTLDNKGVDWDYENVLTDKQKEDFVEAYIDYGLGANYFTQEILVRTEKAKELTATERKEAKSAKEIAEAAPQVYTDIFQNSESYFRNKKVGGKDVLKVNVLPGSVPADGGKVAPVIELGYKSGSKVAGEEQTIFTTDMSFDLSDPARVRALINMLPENDAMKKELIKLIGDDPIESVSIETFEQNPPIYKGISL